MKYISVDILKKHNCCEDQVKLFKELFPTGIVEFNSLREAELLAKKYSSKFDFNYLGYKVFGDAYEESKRPHYDTYWEAIMPHWDVYQEAEKPLLDAYIEATKPHYAAYIEAIKPHLDAYEKAIQPHLESYLEAKKPHLDTYELAQSQVFAKLWWELKE